MAVKMRACLVSKAWEAGLEAPMRATPFRVVTDGLRTIWLEAILTSWDMTNGDDRDDHDISSFGTRHYWGFAMCEQSQRRTGQSQACSHCQGGDIVGVLAFAIGSIILCRELRAGLLL